MHVLTVGSYTYTTSLRFKGIYIPKSQDWMLEIREPQPDDSGTYECQIGTTPPRSIHVYLNVLSK